MALWIRWSDLGPRVPGATKLQEFGNEGRTLQIFSKQKPWANVVSFYTIFFFWRKMPKIMIDGHLEKIETSCQRNINKWTSIFWAKKWTRLVKGWFQVLFKCFMLYTISSFKDPVSMYIYLYLHLSKYIVLDHLQSLCKRLTSMKQHKKRNIMLWAWTGEWCNKPQS